MGFPLCITQLLLCSKAQTLLSPLWRFSEWRAHCFGLHSLSLVLIATHVLSNVVMDMVIALIALICWLLTMCHCAKRLTCITSLSLLQPCEVVLSSSRKWENWGLESWDLPTGVWLISGIAGIRTQVYSPPNHSFFAAVLSIPPVGWVLRLLIVIWVDFHH